MTVCLAVVSIIGLYCYAGAQPIGDCFEAGPPTTICTVEADELSVRVSWYDPARCLLGQSINCDSDPTVVADGTAVADCYGWCIACPEGWYWNVIVGWICWATGMFHMERN